MFYQLFILFLTFSLSLTSSSDLPTLGRNYRERCSATEPCNPIKFLECVNGFCTCTLPKETVYSPETGACVALVGHSCLRTIPNERKARKRHSDPPGPEQAYQINCVANAKCAYPEDICECDFRFYKASNGTCLPQRGYGERCSSPVHCDGYRFLTCSSGTCTCPRSHRYDVKNQKCFLPVGSKCRVLDYRNVYHDHFYQHECPEHAICKVEKQEEPEEPLYSEEEDYNQENETTTRRPPRTTTTTTTKRPDLNEPVGTCECESRYKPSLDLTCGKDFGDTCSASDKCSDVQFICRSGTCSCKYPLHQAYDPDRKACVSQAGAPCDPPGKEGILCTDNSTCAETGSGSPFHACRCNQGYTETNEGNCVKGFGSSCLNDEECDPLAQLACVNNQCNCPDKLQAYDEKYKTCLSLVGGKCKNGTGQGQGQGAPACTANAHCVKTSVHLNYGRCICARGQVTTSSRTCVKAR